MDYKRFREQFRLAWPPDPPNEILRSAAESARVGDNAATGACCSNTCPSGYARQSSCIYYRQMLVSPDKDRQPANDLPALLVELPSRPRAFLGNLWAAIVPASAPDMHLVPGEFWPDVLVRRRFPWNGLLQSAAYHGIAYALLLGFTHLFSLQPRVEVAPRFDHSEVVYYQASDALPPLDTRQKSEAPPRQPDPELSRQPIISVPPEADNRSQTLVTLPKLRLKHDVALPNIVAWSDDDKKPRLAIPDAPLTPAADITRMAPRMADAVVAPAPDAGRLRQQRNAQFLQSSVVAPPPQFHAATAQSSFQGLQPTLIAPPPSVEDAAARPLGSMNIAPSAVIAPAPQLPLAAQRVVPGGRVSPGAIAAQVVPPPPSVLGGGSAGASFGSRGRVIALSLHPAVGAPPAPPTGNRRGTFSATPEGHAGATGSPGSTASGLRNGNGGSARTASDAPSGLYVGKATDRSSAIVGTATGKAAGSVSPSLLADARRPRVNTSPEHSSESAAKLSEPERAVFSGRRFYSLTLNMPNLNSAGGSWVVHFAEAKRETSPREGNTPANDISQPTAIRKVDPAYPLQLMRENVAGTVILYAVIHADGTVGDIRVLRGVDERLDRFASDAVARWKFEPATKNGVPVDVDATFQIPFRPSRRGTGF